MRWEHVLYNKGLNNEELIIKAKNGDNESKELLFKNNIPYVRKMSRGVKNLYQQMNFEDLVETGFVALTKAYNKYNSDCGYKFTTFLSKILRNEFATFVKYQSKPKFTKYKQISFDSMCDRENNLLYHETVPDEYYLNNETYIPENDLQYRLKLFNKIASIKEKKIIHEHYVNQISLSDISKNWGVTRQVVSALHVKALGKLRKAGVSRIAI